jgi:hypothetical protein
MKTKVVSSVSASALTMLFASTALVAAAQFAPSVADLRLPPVHLFTEAPAPAPASEHVQPFSVDADNLPVDRAPAATRVVAGDAVAPTSAVEAVPSMQRMPTSRFADIDPDSPYAIRSQGTSPWKFAPAVEQPASGASAPSQSGSRGGSDY